MERPTPARNLSRYASSHCVNEPCTLLNNRNAPSQCADPGCEESFSKHHQLRTHTCTLHAPAGTKPYACTHPGCPKSFSTNQKLTTHVKVHEGEIARSLRHTTPPTDPRTPLWTADKRYACVHPACLPGSTPAPAYFATWTALQHHVRTAHPPACPHASCDGRTFTQQKGLRAHLRLHEQRAAGDAIERGVADARAGDEEEPERPQKRRRGGEFGRDWRCDAVGCDKDFKSVGDNRSVTHALHRSPHAARFVRKGPWPRTTTLAIWDAGTTFVRGQAASTRSATSIFSSATWPRCILPAAALNPRKEPLRR